MDKKKIEIVVLGSFILMAVVFLVNIFIARYERKSANSGAAAGYARKVTPVKKAVEPAKKSTPAVSGDEPDTNIHTLPGGALLQ
ncbi:MAG: hypothetical protein WC354_06415 [Candidatus Omnitrophota bacterium]|jgi:hypothetical protein